MNQTDLRTKLQELISLPDENEYVEFKSARKDFSHDKLGKYFSAISNEANIHNQEDGWLVLGIDRNHNYVGTGYKQNRAELNRLKQSIKDKTNIGTFTEIYELYMKKDNKEYRILMFKIKGAPRRTPISWGGHFYGRTNESLEPLSVEKIMIIRNQDGLSDWSKETSSELSFDDLDANAIQFLRKRLSEIKDDNEYITIPLSNLLKRLNLTVKDKLTNTAILFLGKAEIAEKYLPEVSKITWKYEDIKNNIISRNTYTSPLLPKLDQVLNQINQYNSVLNDTDLFRNETKQYGEKAVEELLINSLAHRDWTILLWNEVIQTPSSIKFINPGNFRADLKNVLLYNDRPEYINPNMSEFLRKLNLMEREASGLQLVYNKQLRKGTSITTRFEHDKTEFQLQGRIQNEEFAKLVLNKTEISLENLILLDSIASDRNRIGKDITKDEIENLHKTGFIEIRGGKYQRVYLSKGLASKIGRSGTYIRSKGLTKEEEISRIFQHIKEFGKIQTRDLKHLFPKMTIDQAHRLLVRNMYKKQKALKRIEPSRNTKDWYFIKNDDHNPD